MTEDRGISMNEFKTVVESFRSEIRKVAEVTNHLFVKMTAVDTKVSTMETKMSTIEHQVGLLMEGQTEIKTELREGLKDKVSYREFDRLEKRVTRLEKKTA